VLDQLIQSALPKDVAHGAQQIERQIRMTVGEPFVTSRRQPPVFPWPSPPFASVLAFYQTCRFELEEMLTRAGRGHVEARPDVGRGLRSQGLQMEQDAILTAILVLTHELLI
jgi:molybdopterin biosynthesis enzyme